MKNVKWIAMLMLLVLALAACGGGETKDGDQNQEGATNGVFKIGVIPALTEGNYEVPMQKLEVVLSDALSQEVEITTYPDYNGVVEALNNNHIQMAYLGPATYIEANHRSGAQAIITQEIEGVPYYYSYIVTQADAKWNTIEDLVNDAGNISFAFGDQGSTSGSLIPSYELKQRGVWQDENTSTFREMRYTGSHDATGLAVQNNQVDAGAIDSAYYDLLIKQGKLDESKFKVIWKSDQLFQYPWAVSSEVDQTTMKLLQDTFVGIKDKEILGGFGASAFVLAKDEDYEPVRKVMKDMGRLK
jgi:phosphonate transport system substrate-binding protein